MAAIDGVGARVGDDADFEQFVAAASGRFLGTAYLLTRDRVLAEDLLQTALLKTWQRWSRVDDPDRYLRRVLVTTWAAWWRRRWRGETPTAELPETADHGPDAGTRMDLWEAVGRLPRRQRAVVVLRFHEDLSVAETAALLGVSDGTVKSQTSHALKALRIDPGVLGAGERTEERA